MKTIHVIYDKKNNALGVVEVGDKDLPEAFGEIEDENNTRDI
nr:MAG TPA: hypothetical protein [Caudoviricetes sp.]